MFSFSWCSLARIAFQLETALKESGDPCCDAHLALVGGASMSVQACPVFVAEVRMCGDPVIHHSENRGGSAPKTSVSKDCWMFPYGTGKLRGEDSMACCPMPSRCFDAFPASAETMRPNAVRCCSPALPHPLLPISKA